MVFHYTNPFLLGIVIGAFSVSGIWLLSVLIKTLLAIKQEICVYKWLTNNTTANKKCFSTLEISKNTGLSVNTVNDICHFHHKIKRQNLYMDEEDLWSIIYSNI